MRHNSAGAGRETVDQTALFHRALLLPAPLPGDRGLAACHGGPAGGRAGFGGQDQRQPDPARDRFPRATDLLQDRLPDQANGNNPVVLEAGSGKLTDAANGKAVDSAVKRLRSTPHVISAVNPLGSNGAAFLSKDRTVAYVPAVLDVGPADLTEEQAQAVLDAADPAKAAGIEVSVGGYVGQQLSKPSTEISEVIGLTAAVIILLTRSSSSPATSCSSVIAWRSTSRSPAPPPHPAAPWSSPASRW
ncbi:MAG: MMPL family transporter [Solirubrobacterales bacterium]